MNSNLQKRCEMFIANRDIIRAEFSWESAYIYPLCAVLFTEKGVVANGQMLRECNNLLKANTGVFSSFRGTSKMATITAMALAENPADKLEKMLEVYNKLKEVFWGSEYLTVATAAITDLASPAQYADIALQTRRIYNHMKEAHPFLTSSEDSAFAALLALSGLEDQQVGQEIERCYQYLKGSFWQSNAVQSLSHVLALGAEGTEHKCQKAFALYEILKDKGYKYGTSFELPTLGALTLTGVDIRQLAEQIMEADDYLQTQKGFGVFGIGPKQRLMYAGMLVMCDTIPHAQTMEIAALNGIVAIVIAQQAAICAAVVATSAATTSSSST